MHQVGMTEEEWRLLYKDQIVFRAMREFLFAPPDVLVEADKIIYWSPVQGKAAIYGPDGYETDVCILLSESQKDEMLEFGFIIQAPR